MNTNQNQTIGQAEANDMLDLHGPAVMATAMQLIAGLFYDPYEHTDLQSGEVSVRNSLGFWQDGVLAGILYQLHSKLEYSLQTTLPKAKAACQVAIRAHKGDEISETTLQRAVSWVQRLTDQVAFVQQVLVIAEDEYTLQTGKVYAYRSRATANADVVQTPAMLAAKALGIGVANVAAGFGSAEPIVTQAIEKLPAQDGSGSKEAIAERAAERKRGKR